MTTNQIAPPIQPARGTYLLLAQLDSSRELCVGRLGAFDFPAGWYAYAGSALGPGGLAARLARHRRTEKRLHWHIDYLLAAATLDASWQIASPVRLECVWANALSLLSGAERIVPGFGASDCRCAAHLVYWAHHPCEAQIRLTLAHAAQAHGVAASAPHLIQTHYSRSSMR